MVPAGVRFLVGAKVSLFAVQARLAPGPTELII
jgi:hypothetical protein